MGNDLRSQLRSAIDSGKVAAAPAPAPAPSAPAPAASPAPAAPSVTTAPTSPARDEGGRFAGKQETAAPVVAGDAATGKGEASAPPADASPKPTTPKYKPPASWRVPVREKWDSLPPEVQEEIDRVNREATQRIEKAAKAERFLTGLSPFEAVLQEFGGLDKGIPELLKREMTRRAATPQERARMIAEEIQASKVPVEVLDQILAERMQGAQNPGPVDPDAIAKTVEQRIEARIRQVQQAQAVERATRAIEEFREKHEFADAVKDTMAGLIEGGIAKNLEEAYSKAIALTPEIREVLEQRAAAEAAKASRESVERSKAAAMSVRSSPVSVAAPAGNSLREQIAAQVAAAGRR